MAHFSIFNPPGNNPDFAGDAGLAGAWNSNMSKLFDGTIGSVTSYLNQHGGGACQFYNPVSQGRADPDLPVAATDIPWNGFPKRHGSPGPGQPPQYAAAEAPITAGQNRDQDEYLEWFVNRKNGKIVSVHFTCEAYDYFQFLGKAAPQKVLALYQSFVSPQVQMADLFQGSEYDVLNKWNTELGAMHLTHPANNLFAEVFLAGSATVRRSQHGSEITQAIPLCKCGAFGASTRNSDPAIGAAVNGLCRDGRHVTLADPVGLYMGNFNGAGLTVNGQPAGGFFKVVRGAFPTALRAVYELPPELAAQGLTVSDVRIGGAAVQFGGQLAERITMHIAGIASVATDIRNTPVSVCGAVPDPEVSQRAVAQAAAASPTGAFASGRALPSRGSAGT